MPNSLLNFLAIPTHNEKFCLHIIVMCCVSLPSADIISTVEFNHDGEFLATGDKGGRVVIFQRDGTKMRVSPCMIIQKILLWHGMCLRNLYSTDLQCIHKHG